MSTAARKILGSGTVYTVATVAPVLTLLAITPVVTNLLGAQQYGQVAVAISVYQLSSVLLGFGLPMMVTRDALLTSRGFRGAAAHVVTGTILAALGGTVAAAVAPWWAPLVFPGVPPLVVALALCSGWGLAVVTLAQGMMRAAERVATFVIMAACAALGPPLLGLAVVLNVRDDAAGYTIGLALGYVLAGIVAFSLALLHARPDFHLADELRAVLVALPTVPHSLAVPALLAVVMSLVIRADGIAMAGSLQVAVMLGSAVVTILNAVNNAWAPMVMKAPDAERPRVLHDSSLAVSGLAVLLICGFIVVAPFLVPLVGGPVVQDIVPVQASTIVAMSGAMHVAYLANIHMTFISQRTWPLVFSTPLSALCAVALGFVAAQLMGGERGLLGYAMTWPLFYTLQAGMSYFLARWSPYPPADLKRCSVLLFIGAAVALQATIVTPQPLWSIVASAGAGVVSITMARKHVRSRRRADEP